MAQKLYREEDINNIGKAIQVATGDRQTKYLVSEMAHAIEAIRGVEPKDVNFYDYNGKLLYAYTTEEALHLTELPALPDHSDIGLINEGWNWHLEDIQSMQDPCVNVGCTYMTSDGATRVHMNIWKPCTVTISVYASTADTCYIDWGDGSERTSISATQSSFSHEYSVAGERIIELVPSDEDTIYFGGGAPFIEPSSSYPSQVKSMCKEIFFGKNIELGRACFQSLFNVELLSLNTTVASPSGELSPGNPNDGCMLGMYMPIFILPYNYTMNGQYDYSNLMARKISICSNVYVSNQYGASGTFLRVRENHVISTIAAGCSRDFYYGYDNLNKCFNRVDCYYNRNCEVAAGVGGDTALTDLYLQKCVCKPFYADGYSNLHGVRFHVPAILYDDMMAISKWNTTFPGEVIPYESDWQNNYERLIHISELIDNLCINKWGQESEDSGWKATDYISVTPGERIYYQATHWSCTYNFYDSEQTRIAGGDTGTPTNGCDTEGSGLYGYVDVPSNAAYVRFSSGNSWGDFYIWWLEAWRKLN